MSTPVGGRAAGHWLVAWALVAIVVVGVALVRWRLRDVPLERDEGEFAYVGQLLLEGVPPYREAGNHKFPGTYIAYAGLMAAFGESPAGVRTGFILVNAATTIALFVLALPLVGDAGAVAAAAAWAALSLSPGVLGTAAHMTHFVVLPMVGGLALLVGALRRNSTALLAAAGLALGSAVVVRQTSFVFVACGIVWILAHGRASSGTLLRRVLVFGVAALLPVLLMAVWLWSVGVFPQFWRWTVTQALAYGSQTPLAEGLQRFQMAVAVVIRPALLLWCAAGAGLVCALTAFRDRFLPLVTLLGASAAAVASGLLFREHYFVQALQAVALLFGCAIATAWERPSGVQAFAVGVVLVAVSAPFLAAADVLFALSPNAVARQLYGANPFPESGPIANHIREHTKPDDRIAILGSEPQILFLARRRSATGVLYTYPLVETHQYARAMQEETAKQIEAARPAYVVFVTIPTSWLVRPESDLFIFTWARQFLARDYVLDGFVDVAPDGTQWAWGAAAASYRPTSPTFIRIFRRRDGTAG